MDQTSELGLPSTRNGMSSYRRVWPSATPYERPISASPALTHSVPLRQSRPLFCARPRRAEAAGRSEPIAVPEEALYVKSLRRSRSPFSPGVREAGAGVGARVTHGRQLSQRSAGGRGGQGRPVRAARRGSLDGPGGSVVASQTGGGPPLGGPVSPGGWTQRTSPLLNALSWGDRDARRPAIPSRWFAWCVPATARRAHSNRRPRH